ncbi:unnamed protein product [Caenorhabditis brenneri]
MQAENVFAQFYVHDNRSRAALKNSTKMHNTVGAELYGYKHEEAKPTGSSRIKRTTRVVAKKRESYVLATCHLNVHGHYRGDLRFMEVNSRTVVKGSERYSVVGKLYLGDIVAVTELGMLREPVTNDIFHTTIDQECVWMASRITVLPRKFARFIILSTEISSSHSPQRSIKNQIHLAQSLRLGLLRELKEIFEIVIDAFKKTSNHNTPAGEIVETCVLMGYSAANALAFGRLDTRAFPIQDAKRVGWLLHFYIDNPVEKPTEGKWAVGSRISVHGAAGGAHAVIETLLAVKNALKITARLSQGAPNQITFDGLYLVSQMEPEGRPILRDGFFNQIPEGSHGRRILETLYGGEKLPKHAEKGKTFCYPVEKPAELNVFQSEYMEMLQDRENHPIVVGSSPFGCGKSMTILSSSQKQLLITQSNFVSVNLVEIAKRVAEGPNSEGFKFVRYRYITPNNSEVVAEDCLTDYHLPVLQKRIFTEWAEGKHQVGKPSYKHHHKILSFLFNKQLVHMNNKERLLAYPKKDEVSTIQIDEASQLPEYSFVSLLTLFPHANFGLIGDIQQLPPYYEIGLEGKLKDYGIGNTMGRAVTGNLFPQAMLREVYRCHPKTTDLLSDFFYGGKLITRISEGQRKSFMEGRPDFWKNPKFPVMLVNNQGRTQTIGTSCGNIDKKETVQLLLGT